VEHVFQSIQWALGTVQSVDAVRPGAQELTCLVDNVAVPCLAYTDLVGQLAVGHQVWLNQRAMTLRLGTGGQAFVVARADQPPTPVELDESETRQAPTPPTGGPNTGDSGYLVKARYTPLQVAVRGVDSPNSPFHRLLQGATSLDGLPVVTADLHSALPAICAGALLESASLRICYVMTDGAALPAAYSRTIHQLRQAGLLACVITAGQAYGGDYEAVSLHSALLAARHVVKADLVVVAQGPGNLGSHTPWGFTGLAVGEAVNAAAVLQGRPVGCLRISGADRRPRHFGLSHHSVTSYGQVALAPADLVVPLLLGDLAPLGAEVATAAADLGKPKGRHRLIQVSTEGLMSALEELAGAGVALSTMGRGLAEDPAAFLAAAAAGRHAAHLCQAVLTTGKP